MGSIPSSSVKVTATCARLWQHLLVWELHGAFPPPPTHHNPLRCYSDLCIYHCWLPFVILCIAVLRCRWPNNNPSFVHAGATRLHALGMGMGCDTAMTLPARAMILGSVCWSNRALAPNPWAPFGHSVDVASLSV